MPRSAMSSRTCTIGGKSWGARTGILPQTSHRPGMKAGSGDRGATPAAMANLPRTRIRPDRWSIGYGQKASNRPRARHARHGAGHRAGRDGAIRRQDDAPAEESCGLPICADSLHAMQAKARFLGRELAGAVCGWLPVFWCRLASNAARAEADTRCSNWTRRFA